MFDIKKIVSMLTALSLFSACGINVWAKEDEKKYVVVSKDKEARFEAEDYAVINSAYVIGNDEKTFPGNESEYLYIPLSVDANLGFNLEGEAEHYYNLDIKDDGMYDVWVYVYGRDTGARALNYNFDGATFGSREADYDPPGWRWMLLGAKYLTAGKHTMGFIHRHKLTPIDKFVITAEPDFNPEGDPISKPEFLPNYGESKEVDYALPPIVPPIGKHPRLLINSDDIETIRNNLNHEQNASVYQNLLRRAATETDGKFEPMTASASSNISNEVTDVILSNAFLYVINNDINSGKKAIELDKNALMSAEGKGKGTDAYTRYGGHLMFVTACVYDWCFDILSEEEREYLRKYMYRIASMMEVGYPANHGSNYHGHNLELQIWKDMTAVGIAIYDEDPKMYNLIGGRLFEQMIPIRNKINESIFFSEGPTYGPFRFSCGVYNAYLFKGMGYDKIFEEQQSTAMYGQFYNRRPDGRFIRTSDDAGEDNYGYTSMGGYEYFMAGNFYKDPKLKREYWKVVKNGNSSTTDPMGVNAAIHLIMNDVNVPVAPSDDEFPLTAYSSDGRMVARTSWNNGWDSDCVLVQMNTKEQFYGMHDHMDAGHFDIYYKGSLAIDSGVYESDPFIDMDGNLVSTNLTHGSKHWYGYSRRAIAHNVMLVKDPSEVQYEMYNKFYINDGGQKEAGAGNELKDFDNYSYGKMLAADFGPDLHEPAYSYLKGDLKGAYSDKIKNYERTFMFLNTFDKDHPGILMVLDNVESSDSSFKKSWQLHTQEEPVVESNKVTVKRTQFGYNGKLINETLLPEKPMIEKIGGEGHEWEYNGYNYGCAPKTSTQEAGKWRIEVSPSTSDKYDCFLNVMQMSDNDDSIEPLKTELIRNDGEYVGVKVLDRAVFLKKDSKLSIKDQRVSAVGDGNIMFIIDGLREGKWSVYDKNNKKIKDCIVEKEHNVACFEAVEGEYKLTWEYLTDIPKTNYSVKANIKKIAPMPDVQIDKIYETFKNEPITENDVLYLPVEELLDNMNKEYTKEEAGYKISPSGDIIDIENARITVSDKQYHLKNKPIVKNQTVYLACNEFCEAFGYSYDWDNVAKIAYISSGEDIVTAMKLVNSDAKNRIAVKKASCSSAPYSSPYDTVDGNLGSYWGGQGDGEWIMYEFAEESEISCIDIKWHQGDQRKESFEIYLSADGEKWDLAYSGESDGVSKSFERCDISLGGRYKFVKVVGHGNSANDWNSMSEIRFYNSLGAN